MMNDEELIMSLQKRMILVGEHLPKKHGKWYRLKVWGDNYLLYDTWNGHIYQHKGCESTGTDNMYRVVYTFKGFVRRVTKEMIPFWNAHIDMKIK